MDDCRRGSLGVEGKSPGIQPLLKARNILGFDACRAVEKGEQWSEKWLEMEKRSRIWEAPE
jgi:hypothetical protein